MKKIYAVDIDGVIADGKFWKEESVVRQVELDAVNDLYKSGNTIIYHTARHPQYYALTYAWLVKHGAYFHALEMGKLTADCYIDDRNMSVDELLGVKGVEHIAKSKDLPQHKHTPKHKIHTLCLKCGYKVGKKDKRVFGVWRGTCDMCGTTGVSVADAQHDFGYYNTEEERIIDKVQDLI